MRLRMLLLPVVATAALVAAGCTGTPTPDPTPTPTLETNGVEDLEAEEILQRATDALDEAGSFRISGTGETEEGKTEVDAVYAGNLLQGTFTTADLEVEIIAAEDGLYVRAGDELWQTYAAFLPPEAQAMVPLLSGKYVKVPSALGQGLVPDSSDFIAPDGEFTKGEVTEYGGQPAITLVDSEGGELYISLVGEPYPLAYETAEGTIEFTEIGEDVTIEPPAAGDVVDLGEFLG